LAFCSGQNRMKPIDTEEIIRRRDLADPILRTTFSRQVSIGSIGNKFLRKIQLNMG